MAFLCMCVVCYGVGDYTGSWPLAGAVGAACWLLMPHQPTLKKD